MPQKQRTTVDILKVLDKSNCKECGSPTCLAFAALVVQGKKTLRDCPHLSEEAIEALGGRVSSSVSRKTDFVVVGREPGSKYDEARRLGIRILDEARFKAMIGR